MKLYASVTSERATKGQGGNELHVNIMGADKKLLWFIDVEERNGKLCLDVSDGEDERRAVYLFQDEKGKRQKGERANHHNCAGCRAGISH